MSASAPALADCAWYAQDANGTVVTDPNDVCDRAYYDHVVCPEGYRLRGIDMCSHPASPTMIPVRGYCCSSSAPVPTATQTPPAGEP